MENDHLKALEAHFHAHAESDLEYQHQDIEEKRKIDEKQERVLKMLEAQNLVMTEHIKKVEPYLQGAAGFGILWRVLVAIGGAVLIWVQIKSTLWPK